MKPDLMEILVCPVCKGELQLTVDEERDGEIVSGSLFCARCNERYPIEDTIPNLLPPDMRSQPA
ncbi:MAG TPA: methytransferase partner Trm112 [Dehalococcoidia bacterium]|nr:methytransferase partner Trm112 [Dehalococcoidia bacterium]